MKEIGEELREKREGMGLSLEEAASDINYKASQLQAIEEGNFKDFKDKFLLKTIIADYAKKLEKMENNKIASPYTNTETNRKNYIKYIIIGLLAVLFVCVAIFVINMIVDGDTNENFNVGYVERVNI